MQWFTVLINLMHPFFKKAEKCQCTCRDHSKFIIQNHLSAQSWHPLQSAPICILPPFYLTYCIIVEQELSGQDLTLWLCLYINSHIEFWANTEHCQMLSLPNNHCQTSLANGSWAIASWLKRGRCRQSKSPVPLHRDQNRRRKRLWWSKTQIQDRGPQEQRLAKQGTKAAVFSTRSLFTHIDWMRLLL